MKRNIKMPLSVLPSAQADADAATLQRLGTMYPFDPLGIVGQIKALSQQQVCIQHFHWLLQHILNYIDIG